MAATAASPLRMGQYLRKPKRMREDEGNESPAPSTSKRQRSSYTEVKEAINGLPTVVQPVLTTCQKIEAHMSKLHEERTPRATPGPVFAPVFSATQVLQQGCSLLGPVELPPLPVPCPTRNCPKRNPDNRNRSGGLSSLGDPTII